jgi:hypothetical protein
MSYYVESRWGGSEHEPSASRMLELLEELETSDPEHPDTWLTNENGWTLAVHETGVVVWDNLDAGVPARHLTNVAKEKAFELWRLLVLGRLNIIEQEPWQPGNGPPVSGEERAKHKAEIDELLLAQDKQFYDSLGEERPTVPCREPNCNRGAIALSVLCRIHHFEMIQGRPSPFSY